MRYRFAGAAALLGGALFGAQADAQPAAQGATTIYDYPVSELVPRLSEVIVTAQRREEKAQHVGIALSVLSGKELLQRGVSNVNGLQYQTPSLEITPAFGGGQPNFRLRDVGFDDYASNNASPVGIYVDEVDIPFPIETQGLLYDISRVEVLRGPQGTLWGRNTTGGAINFVTNGPTDHYAAGLDASYGNYGYGRVEGYVSGPIAQGFDFRISGVTEQGGGFEHERDTGQSFGDADRYAFRGQIEKKTDKLDVKLEAWYDRDRSDGQGLYLFQPMTTAAGVIPADSSPYATGWGTVSSDFTELSGLAGVVKPFRNNTGDGVDLHIDYDLGFARLTSITGLQNFARKEFNDWDATGLNYAGVYFDTGSNAVSQELRLTSEGAGPLQWVTGFYYDSEHLHDAFISDLASSLGFAVDSSYRQQAQTWAVFGQVNYQLTDKLKIIGGLRLEREVRKLLDYTTAAIADGAPIAGLGVSGADSRLADDEWSGRLEADYQVTPAALIYASISRGVKSGGFSAYNTVQTDQLAPFQPETLLAYETGFKAEFLDHRLRLDGAAYYYQYHDQQVQSAIETFAGPIGNIVNAPRSRIFGGELEAVWTPVPALEIDQTLGYKRAQYLDYTGLDAATGVVVDRNGQDEGWPKLNYSGAASYRWDFDAYRLTAAVDYSYRGELRPVLLGPTYDVASYWLFNANLTLASRSGPWSVGLWGRNIFNQRYDLTRNFFTTDSAGRFISVAAPGAPATYGVRVTLKY